MPLSVSLSLLLRRPEPAAAWPGESAWVRSPPAVVPSVPATAPAIAAPLQGSSVPGAAGRSRRWLNGWPKAWQSWAVFPAGPGRKRSLDRCSGWPGLTAPSPAGSSPAASSSAGCRGRGRSNAGGFAPLEQQL